MKRRSFFKGVGLATLFSGLFTQEALSKSKKMEECTLKSGEVQHMVIFNLPYPKGAADAEKFLKDGTSILSGIPVVNKFQAFIQASKKNDYQYGFSMVFKNQEDYKAYNSHPDHVSFVQNRWEKEVTDFLEIDFEKPA